MYVLDTNIISELRKGEEVLAIELLHSSMFSEPGLGVIAMRPDGRDWVT